jgi:hypothetical protein
MTLPQQLCQEYSNRLNGLASEGFSLMHRFRNAPTGGATASTESAQLERDQLIAEFYTWKTNASVILSSLLPASSPQRFVLDDVFGVVDPRDAIPRIRGVLEGAKENLDRGFLGDLRNQVEAELAADYMNQAEALLGESTKGQYDHVPAAVLAGAVLEKALRVLCSQHQPPISVTVPGGKAKTLNPLIDSLKKASVFNEAKAKQLRAWADLRNHAAHGEFAEFSRGDVEQMIKGITMFLAEHLK